MRGIVDSQSRRLPEALGNARPTYLRTFVQVASLIPNSEDEQPSDEEEMSVVDGIMRDQTACLEELALQLGLDFERIQKEVERMERFKQQSKLPPERHGHDDDSRDDGRLCSQEIPAGFNDEPIVQKLSNSSRSTFFTKSHFRFTWAGIIPPAIIVVRASGADERPSNHLALALCQVADVVMIAESKLFPCIQNV